MPATIDPMLGPIAPELGWAPAPRYLMRRQRIHTLLRTVPRGRLLEIGPGAGTLIAELSRIGFQCEALEPSAPARRLALRVQQELGTGVPVRECPAPAWRKHFDVVCAFDVLEHVEDDRAALVEWGSWLCRLGTLLISVPAHTRMWSAGDEWAGHYRRYEREPFCRLLQESGFAIEVMECYGFPVANLSERLGARGYSRRMREEGASAQDNLRPRSDRSGIDRAPQLRLLPLLRSAPGRFALRCAYGIQALFRNTDLGSGYIVRAKKL